jgi:hypothetical protein
VARSTLTPPVVSTPNRRCGARGDLVGVALQDVDALRRHAELLGDQLRVRLVACPLDWVPIRY